MVCMTQCIAQLLSEKLTFAVFPWVLNDGFYFLLYLYMYYARLSFTHRKVIMGIQKKQIFYMIGALYIRVRFFYFNVFLPLDESVTLYTSTDLL